jgi:2-isopropylmalate synthase
LFGNGERTGNVCLVTVGLNLFSQGIDPTLDFREIGALKSLVEEVNRLPVHPRHPYAGELVYTAFSGSHQDAIKKGLSAREAYGDVIWEVPYLPIDPKDVGRNYEAVIRVNSQSGKAGVAYLLEQATGYVLPRALAVELSQMIQAEAERDESEIAPAQIAQRFEREYVARSAPLCVTGYRSEAQGERQRHSISVEIDGTAHVLSDEASGPIDAFVKALGQRMGQSFEVESYSQHAIGAGKNARAVAYVRVVSADGRGAFGAGVHESILMASLSAVAAAANRVLARAHDWKAAVGV